MAPAGRVLVTGPTGTVGSALLALLAERGLPVVAGGREGGQAVGAAPGGSVESRGLDFTRPETFAPALAGVDRVFLMRPPAISDTKRYLRPFVRAAAEAGVRHVVFLSLMGVNRVMPHWQVEQDLRASGSGWTFLRPSFFAQNLQTALRRDIVEHDAIRQPSGRGRTSFVDTRDVAAVAALALDDPAGHAGVAYTLTGPEALDYHRVASMLSAELGRPIVYDPPSLPAFRREQLRHGRPSAFVTVQLLINVIARLGLAARVTDTVERLLGRPATPLATYLHDHRSAWERQA